MPTLSLISRDADARPDRHGDRALALQHQGPPGRTAEYVLEEIDEKVGGEIPGEALARPLDSVDDGLRLIGIGQEVPSQIGGSPRVEDVDGRHIGRQDLIQAALGLVANVGTPKAAASKGTRPKPSTSVG